MATSSTVLCSFLTRTHGHTDGQTHGQGSIYRTNLRSRWVQKDNWACIVLYCRGKLVHPSPRVITLHTHTSLISWERHDDQTLADISNPLPSGSKGHLKGSTIRPGFANLNVSPEKGSQGQKGGSVIPTRCNPVPHSESLGMIGLGTVTHPSQEHQTGDQFHPAQSTPTCNGTVK